MTESEKRDKVVKGLEICVFGADGICYERDCPYHYRGCLEELQADILALLKAQNAFMEYFAELYGKGLEVTNWHQNGAMEPLDNFIDSAMEEMRNAR